MEEGKHSRGLEKEYLSPRVQKEVIKLRLKIIGVFPGMFRIQDLCGVVEKEYR